MSNDDSAVHVADDDEENDDDNDEEDDVEVDEEDDDEPAIGRQGRRTSRGITLNMLLKDNILHPGEGTMSIDYLGKKFVGDLLANGKIRWQETRQLFNSPSAWAIFCKKLVNPERKSGCGWASVKFKGKKLDFYKTAWYRKYRPVDPDNADSAERLTPVESQNGKHSAADSASADHESTDYKKDIEAKEDESMVVGGYCGRLVVRHSSLGLRTCDHDPNTLVESTTFSSMGKIQPFTVTLSTNCLLLMDFHCHLTKSEVVGYLAGIWDIVSHNLAVIQAFPCKCRLGDKETAPFVEEEIRIAIEKQGLSLLGWYHSHPECSPAPTLRDISCQMDYQIKLKGSNDAAYVPCVGIICSPYNKSIITRESAMQAFWVMPPQENRPMEFGKPMLMSFTLVNDSFSHDVVNEMRLLHEYYKGAPDMIPFDQVWRNGMTYRDKLQSSLLKRRCQDISEERITEILNAILGEQTQTKLS